jgi:hypothetical protein
LGFLSYWVLWHDILALEGFEMEEGRKERYGLVGCFVDAVAAFCVADCAVGACVEGLG